MNVQSRNHTSKSTAARCYLPPATMFAMRPVAMFMLKRRVGPVFAILAGAAGYEAWKPRDQEVLFAMTRAANGTAELRDEMRALRTEMHDDFNALKEEMHADVSELRMEMRADIEALKTEVRGDFTETESITDATPPHPHLRSGRTLIPRHAQ